MGERSLTRRRYLLAAGASGVAGLAGCGSGGGDSDGQDGDAGSGSGDGNGGDGSGADGGESSGGGESGEGDTPTEEPTATPTEEPEPIEAWPTFQHDAARTGYVPGGTPPTAGVTERWSVELAKRGAINSSPAVANGAVYVGFGKLHALDAANGTEQWTVGNQGNFGSPTVADGTVYAADKDRAADKIKLYALDAGDGSERWSTEVFSREMDRATTTVAGGTVFVGPADAGFVTALNPADGSERWSVGRSVSSPAVADGTAYVLGTDGTVTAYSVTDGSEQWSVSSVPSGTGPPNSPTVVDGTVYAAGGRSIREEENVSALSVADGSTQWSVSLPGDRRTPGAMGSPAVSDEAVYLPTNQGVFALNRDDGSQRWLSEIPAGRSDPAVVGDTVYVRGEEGNVYALNAADGSERWSFEFGTEGPVLGAMSSPAVADGTVYVGGTASQLYALTEP